MFRQTTADPRNGSMRRGASGNAAKSLGRTEYFPPAHLSAARNRISLPPVLDFRVVGAMQCRNVLGTWHSDKRCTTSRVYLGLNAVSVLTRNHPSPHARMKCSAAVRLIGTDLGYVSIVAIVGSN